MTTVTVLRQPGGASGRALAEALSRSLNRPVRTASVTARRRARGDRYLINWGVSETPANIQQRHLTVSNTAQAVSTCADKRATFRALAAANVAAVLSTDSAIAAEQWLAADGKVVVRHIVNSHSANGLEIVRRGTALPRAPLYTRYFRKQAEYRVHVFYGRVILLQQKKRMLDDRADAEGEAELIRTHANGWVFAVNDLACDRRNYREALTNLALAAARAVGANHCAVDVLVNHEAGNNMAVVELNSAPAIKAGSTLEAYTNAFTEKVRELT